MYHWQHVLKLDKSMAQQFTELTQAQRDRLAFIELRLRFIGDIRRQHLSERFGIQSAAATRDLTLYKELASENIEYDTREKNYILAKHFTPLFAYPPERILAWLTQGFGDGEPSDWATGVTNALPTRLTQPNLDVLAATTRAIHQRRPLKIVYQSLNGSSERTIIPFALLDNGLRWHVRGYDRKSNEFRDFVITRIQDPQVLVNQDVLAHERSNEDTQWTRIVELELVPHPDQPRPEVTEMDYAMVNGVLKVKLRAATAGYILRQWSVDCSPDHSLRGHEHRLWLKDHLLLYGVKNAILAPGYSTETPQR